MKKIIFAIITVLIPFFGLAQNESLGGCMGIKFGTNVNQVKESIKSKNLGFKIYGDTPELVSFTGGFFAGHECVGAIFYFYNNSLHTVKILLSVKQSPKAFEFYEEIVGEVQSKYGIIPVKSHVFRSPYYEGDGYTASAIKSGYADIMSLFTFQDNNAISVKITENLDVMLTYQDSKLASVAIDENNKKIQGDY